MSATHTAVARFWVCVLVLLTTACSANREDPAALRTDTVVVGLKDKSALRPDLSDAEFLIYSPLAVTGADGGPVPHLARSWDVSEAGRVRTWHLRDDVRWHDGEPLTAHDVKFTFDLLAHPDVAEFGPLEEVTALDDFTVRISTPDHDYDTDLVIYPKHLLADLEPGRIGQWDFWTKPVGSGPYRFVRYGADRFLELEANSDYFNGRPRIRSVVLKFIGEAAVVEVLAGNVDIVRLERPSPVLERDERVGIHQAFYVGGLALYLNQRHALFSDPRVRRAVALAIDRRAILEALGLPREIPVTDSLVSWAQFQRGQFPPPIPYDPKAARELLDEAGWIDEDDDGVREKGSVPARFSLLPRGEGGREVLIQEYLRRVGLAAEINSLDTAVLWARTNAGEFDAAVQVLQLNAEWRIRYFGEGSVVGYRNARVAEALSLISQTADADEVDALYLGIQEEFEQDVPMVGIQQFTAIHAIHERIKDPSARMLERPIDNLAELWIEVE